ncbi:hypothetical protein [Streptomyces sp. NPDC056160]|uniref:hypothetical protein n=1 Tax=Streptomyces sp. NPDC056160 TaxID=3345731 RepID=UPI0035E15632
MGDTARPTPERLGDQEEQASHLVRTGNGPTVEHEAELLAEQFGAADMAGFHTGPGLADGLADKAADQDDEPEAAVGEGDAPAADTSKGGESA